jgi:hypothetical protein
MKDQDFMVVEKFSNPIDAELLKHRLENAGIETTIAHVDSSSFVMEVGNLNLIRVWVSKEDYERAVEIAQTEPEMLTEEV